MFASDTDGIPKRKIFRRRLSSGISLCHAEYEAGAITERRTCPDGQFWFILRGGWNLTDDSNLAVDDGPLALRYFAPHQKNTRIISRGGAKMFGIQIPNGLLSESGRLGCKSVVDFPATMRTIAQIASESGALDGEPDLSKIEILSMKVVELLVAGCPKLAPDESWLDKVCVHLQYNRNRLVTMKELGDIAGVHPVYLGATFSKTFGCTVAEYLRRLRLQDAASKLVTTDDEVGEIGVDVGFYDHAHFDRTFRAYLGMPPTEYRKFVTEQD